MSSDRVQRTGADALHAGILGRVWKPIVSLLARFGLAAVWLISGWAKASDVHQSMEAVDAYRLLPDPMVRAVAIGLPAVELILGFMLILGLAVRWTAIVSGLLLVVLIAGVASAWARGLQIDCGCFGGGGEDASVTWVDYAEEIARDVGFLILAAWLMLWPRSPLALGFGSRAGLGPRSHGAEDDSAEDNGTEDHGADAVDARDEDAPEGAAGTVSR